MEEDTVCAAIGCNSIMDGTITFIRLPWDGSKLTSWLQNLTIDPETVQPGDWLCFRHFQHIRGKELEATEQRQKALELRKKERAERLRAERAAKSRCEVIQPTLKTYKECSVPGCESTSQNNPMVPFPNDETLQKKWLIAIGISDSTEATNLHLCLRHFRGNPRNNPELLPIRNLHATEIEKTGYMCQTCWTKVQNQKFLKKNCSKFQAQYEADVLSIAQLKKERDDLRKDLDLLMENCNGENDTDKNWTCSDQ